MQTQFSLSLGLEPEKVDVRSLILHDGIAEPPAAKRKEQPAPEFEAVFIDGASCAWRRTCGRSRQLLVLLVTQGQYYIKEERLARPTSSQWHASARSTRGRRAPSSRRSHCRPSPSTIRADAPPS